MLEGRGLRKAFRAPDGRTVDVLRSVDVTLARGQAVAILGRSGSGKSTLLNVLGALDRPDGGELLFEGQRLTGAGSRALARFRGRHLGFVFQTFNLIADLSAWDNVLLAGRYVGLDRRTAVARAGELFERLGISARRDHLPPALSGGEQQRVAFCRAVLNEPALILADEPTGNLDEENATLIMAELWARARSGRSAVMVVSHRPELLAEADRRLALVDGRLEPATP